MELKLKGQLSLSSLVITAMIILTTLIGSGKAICGCIKAAKETPEKYCEEDPEIPPSLRELESMECIYLIYKKQDLIINEASKYFPTIGSFICNDTANKAKSLYKEKRETKCSKIREILTRVTKGIPECCLKPNIAYSASKDEYIPTGIYSMANHHQFFKENPKLPKLLTTANQFFTNLKTVESFVSKHHLKTISQDEFMASYIKLIDEYGEFRTAAKEAKVKENNNYYF